MRIIGIEGLDKAGKHTVSEALAEHLEHQGYRVAKSEFHRYDTPTGALIMEWLKGEWDVSQETIELIMTADKQAQQKQMEAMDNEFDVLILDRYTTSQMAYGKANGIDPSWTESLQRHMRKPDYEILLDVSARESMSRKGKHNNGENDRYESDLNLLMRVRDNYLDMHFNRNNMFIVDASKSPAEVVENAIDIVNTKMILD